MTTIVEKTDSGTQGGGLVVGIAVASIVAVCGIYIYNTGSSFNADFNTTNIYPAPAASVPSVNAMTLGAPAAAAAPAPNSPAAATPNADPIP